MWGRFAYGAGKGQGRSAPGLDAGAQATRAGSKRDGWCEACAGTWGEAGQDRMLVAPVGAWRPRWRQPARDKLQRTNGGFCGGASLGQDFVPLPWLRPAAGAGNDRMPQAVCFGLDQQSRAWSICPGRARRRCDRIASIPRAVVTDIHVDAGYSTLNIAIKSCWYGIRNVPKGGWHGRVLTSECGSMETLRSLRAGWRCAPALMKRTGRVATIASMFANGHLAIDGKRRLPMAPPKFLHGPTMPRRHPATLAAGYSALRYNILVTSHCFGGPLLLAWGLFQSRMFNLQRPQPAPRLA
jgi:hypothetical protein